MGFRLRRLRRPLAAAVAVCAALLALLVFTAAATRSTHALGRNVWSLYNFRGGGGGSGGTFPCATVANDQVPECIEAAKASLTTDVMERINQHSCSDEIRELGTCTMSNVADRFSKCKSEFNAAKSCIDTVTRSKLVSNACLPMLMNVITCSGSCDDAIVADPPSTCYSAACRIVKCTDDVTTLYETLTEAVDALAQSGELRDAFLQSVACLVDYDILCVFTGGGLRDPSCAGQVKSLGSCLHGLVAGSGVDGATLPSKSAVSDRFQKCFNAALALVSNCASIPLDALLGESDSSCAYPGSTLFDPFGLD